MSDRPVSLAAVRRLIIDCVGHSVARELDAELDALPTSAPATHGGREVSGEAMAYLEAVRTWAMAPSFTSEKSSANAAQIRSFDNWCANECPIYAEHTTPTKPPREMPAPKPGMVVCLAPDVEIQCRHSGWGTWRAFLRAECVDIETVTITRIYWPGPMPVVIWERA